MEKSGFAIPASAQALTIGRVQGVGRRVKGVGSGVQGARCNLSLVDGNRPSIILAKSASGLDLIVETATSDTVPPTLNLTVAPDMLP